MVLIRQIRVGKYLPEDRINVKLKVVNFSSCYFPYINDIIAAFSILSTLVKTRNYKYIYI